MRLSDFATHLAKIYTSCSQFLCTKTLIGAKTMKYRRKYTLYPRKDAKGMNVWYFRVYLPDGTRRAKSTGCRSKEKARIYVESVLEDETVLRKVFQTDLIISIDNAHSLIQSGHMPDHTSQTTFEEYAKPWWDWDNCPYVLARRQAGTEEHPGILNSALITMQQMPIQD